MCMFVVWSKSSGFFIAQRDDGGLVVQTIDHL